MRMYPQPWHYQALTNWANPVVFPCSLLSFCLLLYLHLGHMAKDGCCIPQERVQRHWSVWLLSHQFPYWLVSCFIFQKFVLHRCVRQKEKSEKLSCATRQDTFYSLVSSAHLCNFSSFEKEVHYKIISSWGFAVSFVRAVTKQSEFFFLESAYQLCTASSSFLRHF